MAQRASRSIEVLTGLLLLTVCTSLANGQYVYWRDSTENGGDIFRVGQTGNGTEFMKGLPL